MKFCNVKNSIKDILGEDIKTIQIILRGKFMSKKRSHLEIPFNFSILI